MPPSRRCGRSRRCSWTSTTATPAASSPSPPSRPPLRRMSGGSGRAEVTVSRVPWELLLLLSITASSCDSSRRVRVLVFFSASVRLFTRFTPRLCSDRGCPRVSRGFSTWRRAVSPAVARSPPCPASSPGGISREREIKYQYLSPAGLIVSFTSYAIYGYQSF